MISIVFTLILIGVAMYLVNRFIPMTNSIKTIMNIFVAVVVIYWLLFHVFVIPDIPLPGRRR